MKKPDRGIAIITVILSLALVFILAGTIAIIGNLTYKTTLLDSNALRNRYIAESQMSHTIWNLTYDRKEHRRRTLGAQNDLDTTNPEEAELDEVRYMADGKVYTVDSESSLINIRIDDANKGFDFNGTMTGTKIRALSNKIKLPFDAERTEVDEFFAKLTDYTDRNDFFQPEGGAERDQYFDESGYDLPRNAPMEYAEEVMWIPGAAEALFANSGYLEAENSTFVHKLHKSLKIFPNTFNPDTILFLPHLNTGSFPKSSKPNFFASSDYQIMSLTELTEDELSQVQEARKIWFTEQVNLQESIPEIYSRLRRQFSFEESGVYRIRVEVANEDSGSVTVLESVIDLTRSLPRYRQDDFSGVRFWRQVNF